MEMVDCSLWHHLSFVEEWVNDDNVNALCSLCKRPASGPVYKCFECDFLQHKSCTELPHTMEMEIKHYLQERHHLFPIKEMRDNGMEEVVCRACEEPASIPAYKCSIAECTFLLHESCSQLSHAIQHPLHADHILTLQAQWERCDACLKYSESLHYNCKPCNFNVDLRCCTRWRTTADDCHKHTVIPTLKQVQFTCEACGEERKDIAYQCSICRLIIEKDCHDFRRKIQTTAHDHYLTLTYSVRRVKGQNKVFCRLCGKKVNIEFGAYYCKRCGYTAHLRCAKSREDRDATTLYTPDNCDDYTSQLVHLVDGSKMTEAEEVGPQEIRHFSHPQHDLILIHEESWHDKRCEACMQFIISVPFYGCGRCNFFLHARCAKLPKTIKRGLFHAHTLTLFLQASSRETINFCHACHCYHDGFAYRCTKRQYKLDVQCCLVPEVLEYQLHHRTLFLAERSHEIYSICGEYGVNYVCNDCEFRLCMKCVTLPLAARYRYHPHLLTLTRARVDDFEEYYCLICEEKRDLNCWFYWCEKCDFTVHSKCILGESIKYGSYINENHQHLLTFVRATKDSLPCNACGKPFGRSFLPFRIDFLAVECTQCKFLIHRECQTKMFGKLS